MSSERQKRKNPYQVLFDEIVKFCDQIKYRHKRLMWTYPADQLGIGWNLTNLKERIAAGRQLGYEVVLEESSAGIHVFYRKEIDIPIHWENS